MCGSPPYSGESLFSRRGRLAITSGAVGCFGFPSYSLMTSSNRLRLPRGFLNDVTLFRRALLHLKIPRLFPGCVIHSFITRNFRPFEIFRNVLGAFCGVQWMQPAKGFRNIGAESEEHRNVWAVLRTHDLIPDAQRNGNILADIFFKVRIPLLKLLDSLRIKRHVLPQFSPRRHSLEILNVVLTVLDRAVRPLHGPTCSYDGQGHGVIWLRSGNALVQLGIRCAVDFHVSHAICLLTSSSSDIGRVYHPPDMYGTSS